MERFEALATPHCLEKRGLAPMTFIAAEPADDEQPKPPAEPMAAALEDEPHVLVEAARRVVASAIAMAMLVTQADEAKVNDEVDKVIARAAAHGGCG